MELRAFQKEALAALERPNHVLCVAPTGSGKSLIYERASVLPGRRTLLISPLVALARQQRNRLQAHHGHPGRIHLGAGTPSEPPPSQQDGVWIISPERLLITGQMSLLRSWRPNFLVVDECHCLWEWGQEFRPAFRKIPELISEAKIPSSLWLTATLPFEARDELKRTLPAKLIELGRFDLPANLEVSVARVPWPERTGVLLGWVRQQHEPGIVFAPTREAASRLARLISATGASALAYHAGLSSEERVTAEQLIGKGQVQVVVATSAFGMGMDYSHLAWVALWQAPSSLLTFAQAIGRAGRDSSRRARALALWDEDDFRMMEWLAVRSQHHRVQLERVRQFMRSQGCRRQTLRSYFETGLVGEADPRGENRVGCGACDRCGVARMAGTEAG